MSYLYVSGGEWFEKKKQMDLNREMFLINQD